MSADAQEIGAAISQVAIALEHLGNGNACTNMGAIENLASEIKTAGERIADGLESVATAIRESNAEVSDGV